MTSRFLALVGFFALCLVSTFAQEGIDTFNNRESFSASVSDIKVNDFEGIVPNSGFKQYGREGFLQYAGSEFRPGGGGRFGPGPVIVVGGWYNAGPAYETTSGAKLHWNPPNQPGDAYLEITLPGGTTAVGTDIWTAQPLQSALTVTVTTADGKTRTENLTTPARPAPGFIGFTASSPILSLRIIPPKGQTGLIIDNFTIGNAKPGMSTNSQNRAAASISLNPGPISATVGPPAREPSKTSPRETLLIGKTPGPSPSVTSGGIIAYVRGGTEIRTINPDGANDRQLWTHRDLHEELGLFELAWKPDGTQLAFSSAHEATSSLYLADIYTINRDGSGLQKLTNPPARSEFSKYPRGSVTVTINNYQDAAAGSGTFIVYVAGADEPQQIVLPAGSSKTVVFRSVADFGNHAQPVVAMFGKYRWFTTGVDVHAGRNVTSPAFNITGKGYEMLGAFRPVWRSDGSRISYRSGLCIVSSISTKVTPGEYSFNPFFGGKNPMGTCTWDWGPTAASANQVIYSENSSGSSVYQMAEGAPHPGAKLVQFSDIDYQLLFDLHWLPDSSGFLYSTVDLYRESANIFRYDFATKQSTQVTKLSKEFARAFSISPDGQTIVFERCPTADEDKGCDLWMISTNGSGQKLLVRNGLRPAWGR
jgi:TolB protein